jgi:hypothetical protein
MLGPAVKGVSVVSVAVGGVTPAGGVPVTVAEFATCPESTSACVTVYVAVHVVVAPGASVVTGQETVPTLTSVTPTPVRVTLPVFVTTNEYAIVDPAVFPDGTPACLSRVIVAVRVIGVEVVSVAVTAAPVGGVPDTVALLLTTPASTSAWVTVYVAVHVVDAPGANVVTGQDSAPTLASATLTELKVTLPVLVTMKE